MSESALKLSSKYTRKDIHGIFAPEAKFTKGSGTWGIHGWIPKQLGSHFHAILHFYKEAHC